MIRNNKTVLHLGHGCDIGGPVYTRTHWWPSFSGSQIYGSNIHALATSQSSDHAYYLYGRENVKMEVQDGSAVHCTGQGCQSKDVHTISRYEGWQSLLPKNSIEGDRDRLNAFTTHPILNAGFSSTTGTLDSNQGGTEVFVGSGVQQQLQSENFTMKVRQEAGHHSSINNDIIALPANDHWQNMTLGTKKMPTQQLERLPEPYAMQNATINGASSTNKYIVTEGREQYHCDISTNATSEKMDPIIHDENSLLDTTGAPKSARLVYER